MPSLPSFPPTALGHHGGGGELPVLYGRLLLGICFSRGSGYMSLLLFPVPHFPLCSHVHSLLPLHLFSSSANRFICIIFLESIYMLNVQ